MKDLTPQEIRRAKRTQKQHKQNWLIYFLLIIVIALQLNNTGNQNTIMKTQADTMNTLNQISVEIAPSGEPIGITEEFTITHYCPCEKCCGKTNGITATGTIATESRTIAVDPNVIPLGSEVLIDGQVYIAEDVGGAIDGNRIDIFVSSHQEAINRGKIVREVRVVEIQN